MRMWFNLSHYYQLHAICAFNANICSGRRTVGRAGERAAVPAGLTSAAAAAIIVGWDTPQLEQDFDMPPQQVDLP